MKDIFINLAAIIAFLLISQLVIKWHRRPLKARQTKVMIYFAGLVMILISMTFSISINNQFIFDLRVVPFVIGSLFGGPIVSAALYITILIYRLILGFDAGLFAAVIHYGCLAMLVSAASRQFIQSQINKKLFIVMIILGFHMLLSQLMFYWIFDSGLPQSIFWQISFIKLAVIISIVLVADMIDRYHKVRVQLDQLEKMELVYHLSASVSHEVRNGLTTAHGFLQLLNESVTDPVKREYIRISLDEINRSEHIIHEFLTFAKPASKQNKEIELIHVITNTLLLIEPLANMHSIEIKKDLLPITVIGDEAMLQQSFLNFFKNAIEAMPQGGTLEIMMSPGIKEVLIMIRDTGIGMETDQIEQLGTPYYTTKGQKGTGLGMMVAYRAIHQLKGKIEIESRVGIGTTFTIHLPSTIAI